MGAGPSWEWDLVSQSSRRGDLASFGEGYPRIAGRIGICAGCSRCAEGICAGCSRCTEDGKSLEGYDICHCLARIYCFTTFMHNILLFARRHVRAFNFIRISPCI